MPVIKNMGDKGGGHIDTMFIHYSPPRLVEARRWARGGDVDRLQRAALAGHGSRLMRLRLPASTSRARNFLKELPTLVDKCDQLHEAVTDGDIQQLKSILDRDPGKKRLALCRDRAGVGLLHKSVYYDYNDITKYLIDNYPTTVHMKDSDGRTPLHYAAVANDPEGVAAILIAAGAERAPQDLRQHTPAYYLTRTGLLELPKPNPNSPSNAELVIKPANIRIWCHDRDLGRLQQVVWRGEGARLRNEMSSQPAVKKFLEAVPYIMGTIKDIHTSVIENDVEKLKAVTEDPVTPVIFSSRDINGLTALHKAAGLGNKEAVEYIVSKYPEGTKIADNDGRTPLHWAALAKDDDGIYNTIIEHGAPEGKLDNKMKSAGFYKTRPGDIDKALINVVPEAPRTASLTYPSSWDWDLLRVNSSQNQKPKKKVPTPIPEVQPEMEITKEDTPESPKKQVEEVPDSPETVTHEMLIVDNSETFDDNTEQMMMDHDFERDQMSENDITEAEEAFEKSVNDELEKENETEGGLDNLEDRLKTANLPRNISSPNTEVEQNNNEAHEDEAEEEYEDDAEEEYEEEKEKEEEEEEEEEHKAKIDKDVEEKSNSNEKNHEILKTPKHIENNSNHNHDEESKDHQDNHFGTYDVPHVEDEDVEEFDNHNEIKRSLDHVNKLGSEDHDDDDVHVRGESEYEELYEELHKAETADVLDVEKMKNSNPIDSDDFTGRMSQGSESIIEGIVNADPEVDSLDAEQKEIDNSNENDVNVEDEEVQMLIDTCNMEQLAALVLNGEGERLVGQMSQNGELQAFLDNVPSYMNKIKRVHMAARSGGLKELQSALDRRKFAIARDRCSPRGATPLHVAVIFGRTPILRYLAARFPETLSAVDFDGRTALHYAAVLKDNGHYYNLLQSMGANPKDQDDESHTPEDFLDNDKYLSHRGLLKDFGADEATINEMLNDKEPAANNDNNNGQVDIPIFRTEEGRYLASSLGDPLIKGLTEVANQRPKDPIAFLATYLYNFANQNKTRLKTQETNALINSEPPVNEHLQSSNINPVTASQNLAAPQGHYQVPPTPPVPNTPGAPEAAFSSDNRDEHGQSMLHFAAARSHGRGALLQLIREAGVNPAYRDELYRTARDVSIQANIPENTNEIDRWLLEVAARGEVDKINDLIVEGYDHILDVVDEEGTPLVEVVNQRGQSDVFKLMSEIPNFEELREQLHRQIREGDVAQARAILANQSSGLQSGRTMAIAKNGFGRCSLHIAVLAQQDELAEYIARAFPETLRIGDNLERTALHYAMGADNVESLSRILIKAGAKRVLKDLKGRQPSYYFMNKSEILRLKEEEESY